MKALKSVGGEVPTNGGRDAIDVTIPYVAEVTLQGTADFIYHRWNCESIEEKARAAKGSKAKKTDDLESYVYRMEDGELAIPGEHLRMAIINAARFRQDPRSPRKSAMDLYKAGVVLLTALAPIGRKTWDYEDKRRVVIQRNGINRTRPALRVGWTPSFEIMVNLPEYISPEALNDVIQAAGRFVGLGDFRPTYGRFQVVSFKVQ